MSRACWMPGRSSYPPTRTIDLAPTFEIQLSIPESFSYPMGPCWVSTRSQSYPEGASCSATVGLCALRNRPILGCPARSCFLNSDPLSAGSGMLSSLKMELRSVPYGARRRPEIFLLVTGGQGWVDCRMQNAELRMQNADFKDQGIASWEEALNDNPCARAYHANRRRLC